MQPREPHIVEHEFLERFKGHVAWVLCECETAQRALGNCTLDELMPYFMLDRQFARLGTMPTLRRLLQLSSEANAELKDLKRKHTALKRRSSSHLVKVLTQLNEILARKGMEPVDVEALLSGDTQPPTRRHPRGPQP